jgi:hypothetical protein
MTAWLSRQEAAIRATRAQLAAAGHCEHGLPAGTRPVRDATGKPVLGQADERGRRVPLTELVCVACRIAGGFKIVPQQLERDPEETARMRRAERPLRRGTLAQRVSAAVRSAPIRDRARPAEPPPGAMVSGRGRWITHEEITAKPVHRPAKGGLRVVDGGRAPGGERR